MRFLSCSRPPSELARVFLVPVQPRGTVFPARVLPRCPDDGLPDCLNILFSVQAYEFSRVGPCRSLLPVSAAILDGQHSNSMAFGRHRHRQSEFAPPPWSLAPFTPASESFLIERQ